MQRVEVFESYKPLRNLLRKVCLTDSLGVVRGYVQHLQFNTPLPSDVEVHRRFMSAPSRFDKVTMVSEWELETLSREIIINADESSFCPETLRKWSYFARVINKIKDIEDVIARQFISEDNILLELHRLAHRQFPWQTVAPSQVSLTRYFKIYSNPALDEIIGKVFGMDIKTMYLIGLGLLGVYLKNIALFYPPTIEVQGITQESLQKFIRHFSLPLHALKERLKEEQEMNEKFLYAYHSLRAYPLVRMEYQKRDSLVCPLPTLLAWRLTNGVYYEICREDGFAGAFGSSFQNYVGGVIEKAIKNTETNVYPEEDYYVGKNRKNTVDWILAHADAALFIEAKTKRLMQSAKVEINSENALKEELDKMADFLVQIYKTIKDYRDNQYPSFRYQEGKRIFPLVVTLEDWFTFGPKILGYVAERVSKGLDEEGLPPSWAEEMPFSICSVQELENLVQIAEAVGVKQFMERKFLDNEKRQWSFGPYGSTEFPEAAKQVKFLFPEDFERIFPAEMRDKL